MAEYRIPPKHVTSDQMKVMLDFLSRHPDIARGMCKTSEARHAAKLRWCQAAKILNRLPGPKKTPVGWSKTWIDHKCKLKRDVTERNISEPGSKEFRPFTKLEKQALAILGPDFGVPQAIKTNEWIDNDSSDPLPMPTEIKQESMLESAISNGHCRVVNGLQGIESSSDSSDEECVENKGEKSEELLQLSNIYPKWLVELEQKRADTELRRAKAEEQRVKVASKAAEASLIQAQALQRLSEAAEKQANAMVRIATVLESRSSSEVIST